MPLSNGGALDITVGEYFTPNGRNLGGGGVKQGAGITPEVPVSKQVVDTRHGLMIALNALAAKVK
jgi:carboxyl-terminal processing protease